MGKSQSWLGFKSRFEPFWLFDLRCKDSIWNTAIRFAIWFENFAITFFKIVKSREIARIITHYCRHMGMGVELCIDVWKMGTLWGSQRRVRQWRGTVVSEATVTINTVGVGKHAARAHVCCMLAHTQPRCLTLCRLQNVGPSSTFYTHTCFNELPASPWSRCGLQCALHAL